MPLGGSAPTRPRSLLAGLCMLIAGVLLGLLLFPSAAAASHNEDVHTDNLSVVAHDEFAFGSDLAFQGNTVVAGAGDWDDSFDTGIYLYNARRGNNPERLAFGHCDGWHSDVGLIGKFAVQSIDIPGTNDTCEPGKGKEGIRVFDISNRKSPESIGFAETRHGSHNLTTVGKTGLVYISSYNLTNPTDVDGVSIVDVKADPVNPPVEFLEFPDPLDNRPDIPDMSNESGDLPESAPGCHDIGVDLNRELAFCAAITETMIWDISDPRDPVIIEIIRNPLVNIHHGAYANADGNILILNDEWLGATGANTGCLVPGAPTGALWFYDISDPTNPQLQSFWSGPDPASTDDFCTSHFFGAFPDRDWLVTSWYDHGIFVIDFTDPTAPEMVGRYDPRGRGPGPTFWSAYPNKGFLYANSFAPATLTGHDDANHDGGLWVFALDGYSPEKGGPPKSKRGSAR